MAFLYNELMRDVIANRPAAGSKGRRYISTDTNVEYADDGAAWQSVPLDAAQITSGILPAARLPNPSATTLGGVESIAPVSHQFLTGISTSGVPAQAALVAADIPNIAESQVTNLTTDLAAKSPLASPTFTGTPAAPTPSTADNSTQIATTAYVQAQGFGTGSGTVTHTSGALTSGLPVLGAGGGDTVIGTKTGTGDVVFATSPTLVTPALGTPASGNLSNCTGYPTTIAQNSKSAAYTTVLADAGGHIYHPSADTTARTWTIDSNANVAYPIGTALTFVNDSSAGAITIAITSDTLVLAGAGTTGSRTLAANGVATAIKVTSTRWLINGTGIS